MKKFLILCILLSSCSISVKREDSITPEDKQAIVAAVNSLNDFFLKLDGRVLALEHKKK